jgi:hypothetical protein
MALPGFAGAGSSRDGVEILSEQRAGVYDVTVVRAPFGMARRTQI